MPRQYSIADARANLPTIIDAVESGEAVELTRRGKPVVAIVSLPELERLRKGRSQFGDAYRRFLKSHSLREVGLEPEVLSATRARETGRKVSL